MRQKATQELLTLNTRPTDARDPLLHSKIWNGTARTGHAGFESALVHLLKGVAGYIDAAYEAYTEANDEPTPIGTDYVMGPALEDILNGVKQLLAGERGGLDGARLSQSVLMLARIGELKGVEQ